MKEAIILVGPPGSGKTTQALLLEDFGYTRIGPEERKGPRSVHAIKEIIQKKSFFVFDGWPLGPETSDSLISALQQSCVHVKVFHLTMLSPIDAQLRVGTRAAEFGIPKDANDKQVRRRIASYEEKFPRAAARLQSLSGRDLWEEVDARMGQQKVHRTIRNLMVAQRSAAKAVAAD